MRGTKRSAALLLAFGTAFALTPMAGAQEPVKPVVKWGSPPSFQPGARFYASVEDGTCPGGPVSFTSPGFASVKLPELDGTVGMTPGEYTATLKCKDTTEVGTLDFTVEQPHRAPFLDKAEYAPGETIKIDLENGWKCRGAQATSAGFTEPVTLSDGSQRVTGTARAIGTPGTYSATVICDRGTVVNQFTIKAPPTTPPPGTPAPKPKPPIVKPKGAPDTGAGGTA